MYESGEVAVKSSSRVTKLSPRGPALSICAIIERGTLLPDQRPRDGPLGQLGCVRAGHTCSCSGAGCDEVPDTRSD